MYRENEIKGFVNIDTGYVRGLMQKNNVAQIDIAKLLGRSDGYMSSALGRGKMRPEDAEKICYVLDGDWDSFRGIIKKNNEPYMPFMTVEEPEVQHEVTDGITIAEYVAGKGVSKNALRMYMAKHHFRERGLYVGPTKMQMVITPDGVAELDKFYARSDISHKHDYKRKNVIDVVEEPGTDVIDVPAVVINASDPDDLRDRLERWCFELYVSGVEQISVRGLMNVLREVGEK